MTSPVQRLVAQFVLGIFSNTADCRNAINSFFRRYLQGAFDEENAILSTLCQTITIHLILVNLNFENLGLTGWQKTIAVYR